jgi:hypothetical protein
VATLIAACVSFFSWLFASALHLFRVAPLQMLSSIFTSLCSQVFQVVAFLLPLKVMILLGSARVPAYFPQAMAGIERERLILLLAICALVLYLLHLVMDFIGGILAEAASERLIFLVKEGEALAKQQHVALGYYQRMITLCSGITLSGFVLSFLGLFSLDLFVVVFGYLAIVILIWVLVFALNPSLIVSASAQLPQIIDILAAAGFLLVFGFLVVDYLYGDAHGLLLGILALLLCRQFFSRLARALKCADGLYKHRDRTSVILGSAPSKSLNNFVDFEVLSEDDNDRYGFLDGDDLTEKYQSGQGALPFWRLTAPQHCSLWIRDVISDAGLVAGRIDIIPMNAGRRGELTLHVSWRGADHSHRCFLFKAFSRKEAQLVACAEPLLIEYPGEAAPSLVKKDVRNGVTAHLYEWCEQASLVQDAQSVLACREQAFIESAAWRVPEELRAFTKPNNLADRCSSALWARCQAYSRWLDADTQQLVDSFAAAPLRLQEALRDIPRRLYNPDIEVGNIFDVDGTLKVIRWERCTLEPVGSGWPLELGLARLDEVFERVSKGSNELCQVSLTQVRLAALSFAFDERCAQCAYLDAFTLLESMRNALDELERLQSCASKPANNSV